MTEQPRDIKPHNEPTEPTEIGKKGGKQSQKPGKPEHEPTQPNEV